MKIKKSVFAHYYSWFGTRALSDSWYNWAWNGEGEKHSPEEFKDPQKRDIASVYHPLIGPYDSSSPEVLKYQIELAKNSLIDAFAVDWYGEEMGKDQLFMQYPVVDRNFKTLLEVAADQEFSIAVCFEEKILTNGVIPKDNREAIRVGKENMLYIANNYFNRKAYWKIGAQPVLVIWGNHSLPAGIWRIILSAIEQWKPIVLYSYHWPLQRSILDSQNLIDGFYPWMNIKELDEQRKDMDEFYQFARSSVDFKWTKYLCAGVWPSFNDGGVYGWGNGTRLISDPNEQLYALTWEYALKNNPDLVSIATWNDWNEGTIIEPSREFGFKRLEETRRYIAKLKSLNVKPFDFSSVEFKDSAAHPL